jgi:hypothetical protein
VYVIPILIALFLVIAVGVVWAPIFALIIALPLFAIFLGYVGLSRRADETVHSSVTGEPRSEESGTAGGIWGEKDA